MHADAPLEAEYVPDEHAVQLDAPANASSGGGAYVPGLHTVHVEDPLWDALVPPGHAAHIVGGVPGAENCCVNAVARLCTSSLDKA